MCLRRASEFLAKRTPQPAWGHLGRSTTFTQQVTYKVSLRRFMSVLYPQWASHTEKRRDPIRYTQKLITG